MVCNSSIHQPDVAFDRNESTTRDNGSAVAHIEGDVTKHGYFRIGQRDLVTLVCREQKAS